MSTEYSALTEQLIDDLIKWHNDGGRGIKGFTRENFSAALLEKTDKLILSGEVNLTNIDYMNQLFLSRNKNLDWDLPNSVRWNDNHAGWIDESGVYENGDNYCLITGGTFVWKKNDMFHRLDGPAIEKEDGDVRFASNTWRRHGKAGTYWLFGTQFSGDEHRLIRSIHEDNDIPLEIAYLLVTNNIDYKTWNPGPDVPMSWQLKAFEKAEGITQLNDWFEMEQAVMNVRATW